MSGHPDAEPEKEAAPEPEAAQAAETAEAAPSAEERLAQAEAEAAKARDDMLRALAEVENMRRRSEKQANDARVYAIDRFASDLLPVADTLARALGAISPEARANADDAARTLFEGVEMTERALLETFARHGLKRVGAKGDKFDPNLHQAVAQVQADTPAGAIAEVMQPGYVLGERTLRAAIVAVSLGPAAAPPAEGVDIKV
ncbi:MAG: nucleotide exchange factor GrpE [Hyphomonadaceae bacterium]